MVTVHGSESQLLRKVMEACALYGHPMRRNSGRRGNVQMCEPGTPDIEVMLPGGRVAWLELKTPTGKARDTQKAWHARAARFGHVVHVVRSVDEAVAAVRIAMGNR